MEEKKNVDKIGKDMMNRESKKSWDFRSRRCKRGYSREWNDHQEVYRIGRQKVYCIRTTTALTVIDGPRRIAEFPLQLRVKA